MGRVGKSADNLIIEATWKFLKTERFRKTKF
jgi:hypothetical protein